MARSTVSFGMLAARAASTAARSRGLAAGSGKPLRAAVVNSRISLVKTLARFLSCAPLRYMMFLNWEWPAMVTAERMEVGPGNHSIARRIRRHPLHEAPCRPRIEVRLVYLCNMADLRLQPFK